MELCHDELSDSEEEDDIEVLESTNKNTGTKPGHFLLDPEDSLESRSAKSLDPGMAVYSTNFEILDV